jgi:DNA-binding MarR family transcriptional regulator
LAAGLLFIFVSMVLKVVPFISTYYIPIRIVGFVLFVLGVYFEGGLGIQAAMMERVKEMEAKVAAAEAESKKENIKIQEKIVYKQQIVREKGAEVIKYIDREIVKKEGDERSKFSELTDAGVAKIQGAAKDLLKAEESFFVSLGENKQGFDEHLRGILQQQIADAA